MADELFEMIGSGKVKVEIGQRYALGDAAEAQRKLAAGKPPDRPFCCPEHGSGRRCRAAAPPSPAQAGRITLAARRSRMTLGLRRPPSAPLNTASAAAGNTVPPAAANAPQAARRVGRGRHQRPGQRAEALDQRVVGDAQGHAVMPPGNPLGQASAVRYQPGVGPRQSLRAIQPALRQVIQQEVELFHGVRDEDQALLHGSLARRQQAHHRVFVPRVTAHPKPLRSDRRSPRQPGPPALPAAHANRQSCRPLHG